MDLIACPSTPQAQIKPSMLRKQTARRAGFMKAFHQSKVRGALFQQFLEMSTHESAVLSHAFSDKALRNMESFILPQVRTFCELLAESGQKGKTMNMSKMSNYMSFDIMGDLCFGKTFSMQTREDNRFVTELISGRVRNDSVVRMPLFSIIQLSTSFISLKSLTDDMENEG
jgi:hypothetical protein